MFWLGGEEGRRLTRLMIAMLSGWLVSWLGVAALITLTVAFSRNPVPWALLVAWAVLAAVSLVIPGASLGGRIRGALLVLALPFMPFLRAAIALWPHLDAGSARVPPGGLPQLEPVAVKGMHEAARVTDEGGPRAVGPL
jgi:hypothetical protein